MSNLGLIGEISEPKQYKWKIVSFFSLTTRSQEFYCDSPSFLHGNTSWHLCMFVEHYRIYKSAFLSVFLENESHSPPNVTPTFYIEKADGTLIDFDRSIFCFTNHCYLSDRRSYKPQFLVPTDTLTILCTLKLSQAEKQYTKKIEKVHEKPTHTTMDHKVLADLDTLSEDFKNLFRINNSCDITLLVMDMEFHAHRVVLTARSSVFAAMLLHETSEKQTGIVSIPDCDSESFGEFLEFLYSGKLEKPALCSMLHLYQTSEKYNVQKLKTFCSEFLMENLTVEYLCDVVIMADKYDDTKLFTAAQRFFNKNLSNVFATSEWNDLLNNNRHLANKLLMDMSAKVKVTE